MIESPITLRNSPQQQGILKDQLAIVNEQKFRMDKNQQIKYLCSIFHILNLYGSLQMMQFQRSIH